MADSLAVKWLEGGIQIRLSIFTFFRIFCDYFSGNDYRTIPIGSDFIKQLNDQLIKRMIDFTNWT